MSFKKIILIIFLCISSILCYSQDSYSHPAEKLYNYSWVTNSAHPYKGIKIIDNYYISLLNYSMPTTSRIITSKFGYRASFKRQHKGLDIKVYIGDTIYAAFDGQVRVVKTDPNGYGKYIVLRHKNGLETIYGHLSKQLVYTNEFIYSGQPIGLGGNTGRSTGSHLHFEIRFLGVPINPELIYDFEKQVIKELFFIFKQ